MACRPPHTFPVVAGGITGTLVVFRNNISHSRYFEARALLSSIKAGACVTATLAVNCCNDSFALGAASVAAVRLAVTARRSTARNNAASGAGVGGEAVPSSPPPPTTGRAAEFKSAVRNVCHSLQVCVLVPSRSWGHHGARHHTHPTPCTTESR